MKNVTQVLSGEHQNILKVIDIVLNECGLVEKGKETDSVFFKKVVHFIRSYADGFHHVKEEDILFKTMLNNMDNMHCNPIPVMLHEHDEGREYVKGMEDALNKGNKEALIENAKGYCYLLQSHIQKEDNILYPMAEQALDDLQKEQVEKSYNSVNQGDFLKGDIQTFIEGLTQ